MALIKCPECGKEISNLASQCPNCGLPREYYYTTSQNDDKGNKPIKKVNTSSALKSPSKRQFRRLPNGFGQIHILSGNRRKPFAAYPPTKSYKLNGNADTKPLGYFETWQKAYECLYEYNKNPYDVDKRKFTIAELYEMYMKSRFPLEEDKTSSSFYVYQASYKKMHNIHNCCINELTLDELQEVIDSVKSSKSSNHNMKMLLKNMYAFADARNMCDKNLGAYLSVSKDVEEEENGEPFTEEQIQVLWNNSSDPTVQIVLILIYTGFRITELKKCRIDLEDKSFVGGIKTNASKNRYVPMHESIVQFVEKFDQDKFVVGAYRNEYFYPKLNELGIESANGKKHTPHDCRHTFSWLADKYKLDNMSKRMILGHTKGKDVEDNVYGHRTQEQLRKEINKIKIPSKNV